MEDGNTGVFVGHKTEILSWAQTNGNSILGIKSTSQMIDVIFDRDSTEMGQFLRSAGLEQYQQSLSWSVSFPCKI